MSTDDEEIDEQSGEVYVHYNFEVRLVRIFQQTLLPLTLRVRMDMQAHPDATTADLNTAVLKIRYWLDHIVTNCVAFSAMNPKAIEIVRNDSGEHRIENRIMLTPDEPSDDLFALLFQAKLTALAGGVMTFSVAEVESDNSNGLSFTYIGDSEYDLPSMDEWFGEPNWFSEPWWMRNDASMIDIIPAEGADLTKPPAWAFSLDFLGKTPDQPLMVTLPTEFKPKVLDGGKKDK